MSERRAGTKGRRMGSSRRKLLRESSAEAPAAAPSPGEESPWASEMMQKVQDFLKERDKDRAGFITRSDMEKLQEENFPCSREEMELIFDGLDAAGTGRLSTEEFTAGLWQFLSSQKTARHHRRSKMASRRVRLVIPSPVLEGADSEERRHFAAFMEQLGTDNISEEQEIWQLWVKLRQDEPQLLGNLEDFLAKMRHRIQEAKSKKEALELTLNKRVAEHDKEVQQLCQALEQQIQEEQQRLQQESVARGHQQDLELQQALDASEREVQRLVTAQKELEARCHSLHSTQQATSTENQQLEETNRVLEDHLQHLHQQLQETQERLQAARAAVAQGHAEEPRYRVVAELPSKTPLSPQSLEKSEVYHSEMRIRLGSQSTKTKTKSIHQVVWEMPPAEVSFLGPQLRASSTEEDPFPEFLKEEHFSDQSSLLREMNDAIAALNKQLKPQALDAPPALAEAAQKPWNDVEPQMGSEAATGHGTPPRVRQETLSSHIGHEMFEGDLKEGPATAELHVPDVTQAGASMGAGHHRAQELGAEQGETLEEAGGMLFLQGKGSGVKETMPKAAKDQQGAVGESVEAEERVLLEGEGEGWMEEKAGWEKAQLLGEAEEGALYQGENLEVGLGPPEAGEAGLGLSAAPEECVQPPRAGLGEEAGPPVRLSKEHEIHPGEHLEPEPPSLGEVRMGASQEDGVPKGTVAPGPGVREEEHGSVELQPWGETLDAEVLLTQHGGSRGAGVEEGEVEITQPMEAELQPQGESVRGEAGQGGSRGAEVLEEALELVGAEESQADTQLCGDPSPEAPRGGGAQAAMQLQVEDEDEGRGQGEHELPQEPLMVLHGTGLGQGAGSGAEEQPGAEADEFRTGRGGSAPLPMMMFGVQRAGVGVKGDGELPEEDGELELVQGEASKEEDGLFLVKSQGLELAEAEDAQADRQLPGGASPEPPLAGEGPAVMQLVEEDEDGARGQGECELLHEPELDLEGEGAPEGVQPWEEAESLAVLGDQSADANVQETREADKLNLTLGGGTEADLQPPSEAGFLDTEQGGSEAPDVQPLDQLDTPESVEKQEAEDAQEDTQLPGSPGPETLQGRGDHGAMQLVEEAGAGAQGQGECELLHEPELDLEGEGAPEGVQPWEEAESLAVLGDQSADANGSLLLEVDELKSSPGGDSSAALKPWGEQGASMAPDVQPLDQLDTPESVEKAEAEDAQEDRQLPGGASPEPPLAGEGPGVMQLVEEDEDGAQGQGECELLHETELDLEGEGAPEGVQPWEEAASLAVLGDQSTDANVQETREADKLKSTLGGNTEADVLLPREAGYLDPEQGGSEAPGVQLLEEDDNQDLGLAEGGGAAVVCAEGPSPVQTPVGSPDPGGMFPVKAQALELVGAEESQADTQLCGCPSPEAPRGGGAQAAMQLQVEDEDEGRGQGEHELPQEPLMVLHGTGLGQGAGSGAEEQPGAEADEFRTGRGCPAPLPVMAFGVQRAGVGVKGDGELPEEDGELELVQGEASKEEDGLFLVKSQGLELAEAEDAQADRQLPGGASPEPALAGEGPAVMQLVEEDEDGARGQGECELLHEPELDLEGEGAPEGVQPWEEAESLAVLGDQSTDANVQETREADKLNLTLGGGTEAVLQPPSEAGYLDPEQGGSEAPDVQPLDGLDTPESVEMREAEDSGQGECELLQEPELDPQGEGPGLDVQSWEEAESLAVLGEQSTDANVSLLLEVDELKSSPGGDTEAALKSQIEKGASMAPDVQPLDQLDTPESVEMREAEDAQEDTQLPGAASPETVQGRGDHGAMWLLEETEDGEEGQAECELPHEPLDLQGEGSPEDVQPWEESESLAVLGNQSTDANVSLLLEVDELKSTLVGGTETVLQPPSEAGYLDPEQGGSMAPDVQPLDQLDTPETVEKKEAEDAQADRQLPGGASPEPPLAGEGPAVMQLVEEDEEGARGQGECELLHEPELDLEGEGAPEDVQPWEEAESLAVLGDQSADANVQETREADKLSLTLGGGTEADLQPPSEAGYLDPEQGGSVAPDVQPLDQLDTPELLEMREAEDSGQGECELLQEPELDPQGEGPGLDVQPWEEAVIQGVLGDQSTDANVSLLLEVDELKSSPGGGTETALQLWSDQGGSMAPDVQPLDQLDTPGSAEKAEAEDAQADRQLPGAASPEPPLAGEGPAVMQLVEEAEDGADLAPLGPAGVQEREQSQTPGLEAGLHAAHTADVWEGAAGAHVCPPPEATLHPDCAAEGPGLSMMLGALTGADGKIPEDAQTLEMPQAEGADAEDKPLDGAQALEAVQGGRLEAGVGSLVGTQALGIKHGHDEDGLPALAPLVSEAPLQISTLQLMMQEDVLVPDAWQLGGSGQAAQSELQEQVSAQRDKVKLHTASQQPQEPPRVMEREQVAARPAEPPKQEVPPASTLHTRVQQEEGAENDQLGMVLRNSSLRDEAIITVQPQRQLPEEQSKDLHTGQQGKQQEVGWKMSHEGGSSPGVPGPVTAAGAEAGQRSSPEAFLDPDHLYNVLFVGDSHVGKTSFLYRLHADAFNPHLTATVGLDYQVKNLVVDNKCFSLRLWDSAGQERYRSITKQYFRKADGVVLMYDITSEYSFSDVRYWLTCIQEGAEDGVGILLLGNKTDCAAERRVPTEEGERLAKEHQLMFYECSAASGHNVSESMVSFIRLLKAREDELKNKVVEEPRPPQKKGCC